MTARSMASIAACRPWQKRQFCYIKITGKKKRENGHVAQPAQLKYRVLNPKERTHDREGSKFSCVVAYDAPATARLLAQTATSTPAVLLHRQPFPVPATAISSELHFLFFLVTFQLYFFCFI